MDLTYIECDFHVDPLQLATDILMAELGDRGFESFVETDTGVLAYILKSEWKDSILEGIFIFKNPNVDIAWSKKEIAQKNWNAEWEKDFHPIRVGDNCMVRAPFHEPEDVEFDIVIAPKMSFGTGHHETTHMMLKHILETDFTNKTVLDMGCGTGILAILAKMRGAKTVDALDVDAWCYLNSIENVQRNNGFGIIVRQGDIELLKGKKYDIVLANINRNVLLQDIPIYAQCLNSYGTLFLSGFYFVDLTAISSKCASCNLGFEKKWKITIRFRQNM